MLTFTFWIVSVSLSYERPVKSMRVTEMRALFNKEACTYFKKKLQRQAIS